VIEKMITDLSGPPDSSRLLQIFSRFLLVSIQRLPPPAESVRNLARSVAAQCIDALSDKTSNRCTRTAKVTAYVIHE
jgi:hypothetical protein